MHAGGAERVAATLVNAWVARGDDVTLVVTYSGRGQCFYELDARVRLIWLADHVAQTGIVPLFLRRLFALRRVIKRAVADVVISFLTNVNIATIIAMIGLHRPLVACERTNPSIVNNVGLALDFLRRITYRFATRINVQSEHTVAGLKLMVPAIDCVDVIPNPLPPEIFNPVLAPQLVQTDAQARQIVAMGRLSQDKQFDVLIRVFSKLVGRHPEWRLTIWGEGPTRKELEIQIKELALSSRVSLPGRTAQAWKELAAGQIFAMTSRVEGFPNVLLEAMALGLPCISFDCPSGPADLSEGGVYASLIPMDDEQAFEAELSRLMSDEQACRNLGRQAALSVKHRYGIDNVLKHWDAVFARIQRNDMSEYRS